MKATKIILDCDPGIDDALAIAFAHGHPGLNLVGVTTVAGNVGLAKTTANALAVCEFIGAAGTPVTAGCAGPLLRPALDARQVHGDSGLGGAALPPPAARPAAGHAVDYIIDTVGAAPGEITLVATGPLTNIALAVRREPRLADWVREFVIMGGSAGRGNVTPAAEYNIWAVFFFWPDPPRRCSTAWPSTCCTRRHPSRGRRRSCSTARSSRWSRSPRRGRT